jgi:hypothetical protein
MGSCLSTEKEFDTFFSSLIDGDLTKLMEIIEVYDGHISNIKYNGQNKLISALTKNLKLDETHKSYLEKLSNYNKHMHYLEWHYPDAIHSTNSNDCAHCYKTLSYIKISNMNSISVILKMIIFYKTFNINYDILLAIYYRILDDYESTLSNVPDEDNAYDRNNILHYLAVIGDHELFDVTYNKYKNAESYFGSAINTKNSNNNSPLILCILFGTDELKQMMLKIKNKDLKLDDLNLSKEQYEQKLIKYQNLASS